MGLRSFKPLKKDNMNWTKVSEQKPKHNIGVLVLIPDEDNHMTSGMLDHDDTWVLLDEYRIPEKEVTHWMPLPALPTEPADTLVKNFVKPDVSGSFFCANEYHQTNNGCNRQCERCRLNQHTYRKLRRAYRGEVKK